MLNILHIVPHAVFPPQGGAWRPFFMLRELSKHHNVHAIVQQSRESAFGSNSEYSFPEKVIFYNPIDSPPPEGFFDALPPKLGKALKYRSLRRSWRGPAHVSLLSMHHIVADVLKKNSIDVVIIDHVYCMNALAPYVRRLCPSAHLILHAHNVDTALLKQLREEDNPGGRDAFRLTRWAERHLSRYVDSFWACSQEDVDALEGYNQGKIKGYVIPTGMGTKILNDAHPHQHKSHEILFCGSLSYPPNVNGLVWFYENCWERIKQRFPDAQLTIIGKGDAPELRQAMKDEASINWVGKVDSVLPFYRHAWISIAPLLQGSGTRVKIIESMALGVPVVSTSIGAEGLRVESGENILLADDPKDFAAAVELLLKDEFYWGKIKKTARSLIEKKYDWEMIGMQMNHVLEKCLKK